MREVIQHARTALDFEGMKQKAEELEREMNAPDFWQDQDRAKTVSQEASALRQELSDWQSVEEELETLQELESMAAKENDDSAMKELEQAMDTLEKRLERLEKNMLFTERYDQGGAIVSIHAGAGGVDAMDWAEILMRMYLRYAESKEWTVDVLDTSRAEEAGIKSASFAVRGRYAYGHLKNEAGVHRLVRISPFDSEGLRHTSFALLEVIPELDAVTEQSIQIDPKDLRIDTFLSSGKGGQSVNTTYSAIRVTHLPTNIVVSCQNERSQLQNKETAMRVLKARLLKRMMDEHAERLDELKGGHKSPEWGNQIRSYVLHPYQMVKDHRTNYERHDIEAVLEGDIDTFIEEQLRKNSERVHEVEEKV